MTFKDFEIIDNTVYKGVGKLFYEQGMPISITMKHLAQAGIKVSVLHVADECLKHGWSESTTFKKIREDLVDSGEQLFDIELLRTFSYADYETQREIIFKHLFADKEQAVEFLKDKL